MDQERKRLSRPEVAERLGKTVRTLQRWENEDPPVGPPVHYERTAAYYFEDEVAEWQAGANSRTRSARLGVPQ